MTVADYIVIVMTIMVIKTNKAIYAVVLCVALLCTAMGGYKQHYSFNKYVRTTIKEIDNEGEF